MPCTTILVGKNASYDGSTIISRNDDGNFDTKKMIIVQASQQKKKYTSKIAHLEIELPDNPLTYSMIPNVNPEQGLWPACGVNSMNVAMTATESISSNPLVLGADPLVYYKKSEKRGQKDISGGIGEEDLVSIVLPYIKSAREGVIRTGELLEKYGTYEKNGMAFSDENEIWYLESIGGHHYIALRVPDDKCVIAPNRFGADIFDLEDALGEQKNFICSKDLKESIEKNHLDLNTDGKFNPRHIFGSHSDQDHLYNTPRSWYMLKYLNPHGYGFDTTNPQYTPLSYDIPFWTTPEKKVTIEDVRYLLSSHYQGTEYNPYNKGEEAGRYRSIGVPNTDDSAIVQIRGYMPNSLKAIEWLSLGGGIFTATIPLYMQVQDFPSYISKTTKEASTEYFYWTSRIIAALTDAHYHDSISENEGYRSNCFNEGYRLLNKYDQEMLQTKDYSLTAKANEEIVSMIKKESEKILNKVLLTAGWHMKTKYYRGDN